MKLKIAGDQKLFDGSRIGLEVVSQMTKKHREKDPLKTKLHYSHFTVAEIIDLFLDNNVLPDSVRAQLSTDQAIEDMKKYGLKIYLGKHEESNCPPGKPKYKNRTTTILCNTEIEGNYKYRDLVSIGENSVSVCAPKPKDPDEPYLDQTNICPPDSPGPGTTTTQNSIYDIANYKTP